MLNAMKCPVTNFSVEVVLRLGLELLFFYLQGAVLGRRFMTSTVLISRRK